jgi:hypothetical protein
VKNPTMTVSSRTGRRLGWSPAGRLLAVMTLALAVIGMHSLGAGHLDLMAAGAPEMTTQLTAAASPTVRHPGTDMAPKASPAAALATSAVPAATRHQPEPCPGSTCAGADPAGHSASHDMTAMCLAVLPGLLLLLTSLLLRRSPAAVVAGTAWRALTSPIRAGPPLHLTPSLSKLCILRT